MKSVLHILEAVEGGSWRHLKDLIRGLDPERFRCSAVLSFGRGVEPVQAERAFAALNVAVYPVAMQRRVAPLGDLLALLRIVALVRKVRPDIIHVHSSKAGVLGRVAGRLCGVPVVYTPHAFAFLMHEGGMIRSFYERVERWAVKLTAAVICVSKEEAAAARRLGYTPERVHYIPNGIEQSEVLPVCVRESGGVKLGFFGRSARQKGDDTFVRLVAALNQRGVHVEGYLYGVAPEAADLCRLIRRQRVEAAVHLCGSCAPGEVVARMREVDVIVMPSRWEGLPYALLEAWLAGVPVAAYGTGGIRDVVVEGESGVLSAPGDFAALVESVVRLGGSAELRRRVATGGRMALAEFGVAQMIRSTEAVYAGVVPDEAFGGAKEQ